jgi:hypothetical protein
MTQPGGLLGQILPPLPRLLSQAQPLSLPLKAKLASPKARECCCLNQ